MEKIIKALNGEVDRLAEQRNAFMTGRTQDEKRAHHAGYELGLIVAGMHIQSLVLAKVFEKDG